jgi:hypothetical protein
MNAGGVFLSDAGKDALGAKTLDAGRDAWEFPLKRFADHLAEPKIGGGVPDHLALTFSGLDQRWRNGFWRGCGRAQRRGMKGERQRGGRFENAAA